MRLTVRLGRILGIPVGVNAGVLVMVVLVSAGLAFGSLPAGHPGRPLPVYLVAGGIAAVLFIASLLAHELAHAVVARATGVEVEGITLWLLGGVAQLRGEARSAAAELAIAAVGPATSVALGALFAAVTAGLSAAGERGLPVAVAGYLAMANVALAVFNLVPAAPLDGGRVLRAAVWRATGDRFRAARVAAGAGRVFGLLLILAGVARVLFGAGLGGCGWYCSAGSWYTRRPPSSSRPSWVAGYTASGCGT